MIRSLLVFCFGLTVLQPVHGATSTFYGPAAYPLIAPTSTKTFQSSALIPTVPGAADTIISPDGKTAYFVVGGCYNVSPCTISAMDLATGKIVRTYQTQDPITGGLAILPDESQLWAGGPGEAEVFDIASGTELAVIPLYLPVNALTVAPNGATVYALESICTGMEVTFCDGYVTAIDVAVLQAGAGTPDVEPPPSQPIVVGGSGTTGYLLSGNSVLAINLPQMTVQATIATPPYSYAGIAPGPIAVSADGSTLAVVWPASGSPTGDELLIIDTATGITTQTVQGVPAAPCTVLTGPPCNNLLISPDGGTVYFVDQGNLETVNVQSGTITTVIDDEPFQSAQLALDGKAIYLLLGGGLMTYQEGSTAPKFFDLNVSFSSLAVSPNGGTLYEGTSNGIQAVSTATGAVTSTLLPGVNVAEISVGPGGGALAALSSQSLTFTIANASTGTVENTISLPTCGYSPHGYATSMAMDWAIGWGFVVVQPIYTNCGAIVPISLKTQTAGTAISGTFTPPLAVSPGGEYLYAATWSGSWLAPTGFSIDVIDLFTGKLAGSIPITANAIAFSPNGKWAYIAGSQNNVSGLAVVNTSTLAIADFIQGSFGAGPQSIAVSSDGLLLYVDDSASGGSVAIIDTLTMKVLGQLPSGPPFVVH